MPDEKKDLEELEYEEYEDYEDYDDDDEWDDREEIEEEDPKKDRVIQNPLAFLLLCFVMFSIPILWFFGIGNPVNADYIAVGKISTTETGTLEIPLQMIGSAEAFTITTQELEGDILYLKPRFTLVNILHSSGNTVVETKVPADQLSEIWIQGDDETDRQRIWVNE